MRSAPGQQRAVEQRETRVGVAGQRVDRNGQQAQRVAPLQPHVVERRAPGQPFEILAQPLAERVRRGGIGADEAATVLDPVPRLLLAAALAHQPRNARILAA